MQLDLFKDNRAGILLNIVDECLKEGDFRGAYKFCQLTLDEYPDNRDAIALSDSISKWLDICLRINPVLENQDFFAEIALFIKTLSASTLRTAVLQYIIAIMGRYKNPDEIFLPSDFHRGKLLMELGLYSDASIALKYAATLPDIPKGFFLSFSADAMTLSGNHDDAVPIYLQAFLEDPDTVVISEIKNESVLKVYKECFQYLEDIENGEEAAWIPVCGWFTGLFALPLQQLPDFNSLELQIEHKTSSKPRIWFDLLTYAEYYRTVQRNDKQSVIIRRAMKLLNAGMFEHYLLKIQGTFK